MKFFYNKVYGLCFLILNDKGISLVSVLDKNAFAVVFNLDTTQERWAHAHFFESDCFEDAYRHYKNLIKTSD